MMPLFGQLSPPAHGCSSPAFGSFASIVVVGFVGRLLRRSVSSAFFAGVFELLPLLESFFELKLVLWNFMPSFFIARISSAAAAAKSSLSSNSSSLSSSIASVFSNAFKSSSL